MEITYFGGGGTCSTRSIVYKGWLIRDEIHGLVEFEIRLRDDVHES